MKQLENAKRDFKSIIINFLTDTDPKALDADEEKVLSRWELADRLLRAKEPTDYIISQLINSYGISKTTAHGDIYAAMEVFGKSRKLNKQYLLHHHLEDVDKAIQKILNNWHNIDDVENPYMPCPKEIAAVARLLAVKTEIINSLPTDSSRPPMQPPVFMFSLANGGVVSNNEMNLEQALQYADDIISGKLLKDGNESADL